MTTTLKQMRKDDIKNLHLPSAKAKKKLQEERMNKPFVIADITRRQFEDFGLDASKLTDKEMQAVADFICSHITGYDAAVFLAQGRFGIKEAE